MKEPHRKWKPILPSERRHIRSLSFVWILVLLGILSWVCGMINTGKVRVHFADTASSSSSVELEASPATNVPAEENTYILNTNTRKFHDPDCFCVRNMNDSNQLVYVGPREDVVEMGYSPCGHCHP